MVREVVAPAKAVNVAPEFMLVVNVGDVAKTLTPEPVSSVSTAARFALEGVPRNVKIPVPVVVVEGATPAPPPMTSALAARAAEEAMVPVAVNARTPPEVPEESPVPPLATSTVPEMLCVAFQLEGRTTVASAPSEIALTNGWVTVTAILYS
jgi:hypothetical protein